MSQDLSLRIALFLLLALGVGASARLRRRADRLGGAVARSADTPPVAWALRIAGGAFYLAILLWLAYPPAVGWAGVTLAPAVRWLGLGLASGGVAGALWALHHLGRNVTPTAVARRDAELVESGPYRWVRHPLYSSSILTVPGLALVTANLLVLVAGVATFAVIAVRTRREERELLERFGPAYADYATRTGRFLPKLG